MTIGVPKERKVDEYRVGITPEGVDMLVGDGHRMLVEQSAGDGSGMSDQQYMTAGATIVPSEEQLFEQAEMVVKVKEPTLAECQLFRQGQILFSYLHLAARRDVADALLDKKVSAIGYETVQLSDGRLPLLIPMSEIAGRLSVQIGANFLQKQQGGKGCLLSGASGVPPGHVAILGSGVVGSNAAMIAIGLGARVTILGEDRSQLRQHQDQYGDRVTTLVADTKIVQDTLCDADLAIGAVHVVGSRTPLLVTHEMVSRMTLGSVIVDVSVDQGGCFETSHPTTHRDPVFDVGGVLHYGVTNMPGIVPQTSTRALTNASLPMIRTVGRLGLQQAVNNDPAVASGLNLFDGGVYCLGVAETFGMEYHSLAGIAS